jgi:cysteine desulfurase / selenocysteine lyase
MQNTKKNRTAFKFMLIRTIYVKIKSIFTTFVFRKILNKEMFDIQKIRAQFPILSQQVNGKPLVYFDNGATSQKPQVVIDAIVDYYSRINANIHRGVHTLSQMATDAYEESRKKIQTHFNAKHAHEIIFTSGTTESINLVSNSFASLLKEGDEIIVSALEHHSNIVPWQMLCEHTGAKLLVIPMNYDGELIMDDYVKLLSSKTKLVFCNHISNALGTINPIEFIIKKAHEVGAAVLIDGAQACPHLKPDVQALDVDFYVTSAHKMCGPTGVGILYGKEAWLKKLPPYKGGGEMIATVTFEKTTYADLPHKFEAGTPNICGGIVFGTAIDYMNEIGFDNIAKQERELLEYGTKKLLEIEGVEIYGTKNLDQKASVISFNVKGIHPYDVGAIIDKLGIAVRTGHHCAQPIMDFYKIPGTIRASFAFYNTKEEIDIFVEGVKKAKIMLS